MTTPMTDLPQRIEAASGADRALDAEIALAVGWQCLQPRTRSRHGLWLAPGKRAGIDGCLKDQPRFTESVDAALTLVPEHFRFIIDKRPFADCRQDGYRASVWCEPAIPYAEGSWAATPALALCAASLKAHIEKNQR